MVTMLGVYQLIHFGDELIQVNALISYLGHAVLIHTSWCEGILKLFTALDFSHKMHATIKHHIIVIIVVSINTEAMFFII